jgi:hypothetical protein
MSGPGPHDLLMTGHWESDGEIVDVFPCRECGCEYSTPLAADACCQD